MFNKIEMNKIPVLLLSLCMFTNNAVASYIYDTFIFEEYVTEPSIYYSNDGVYELSHKFNISSTDGYTGLVDIDYSFWTYLSIWSPDPDNMNTHDKPTFDNEDINVGSQYHERIGYGIKLDTPYYYYMQITMGNNDNYYSGDDDGYYAELYVDYNGINSITKSVPEPAPTAIFAFALICFVSFRKRTKKVFKF